MPVLLLVLGRTLLWIPADGGKTQGQRLPAAAVGGQRAGTCWGAWAGYLRLPRGAEGSWSVRAHQTGGPGTRRGSGLAGARSQRKSRTGCEEEHGIHRQQKWGAVGVSSQAAQVLSCPAQLSSAQLTRKRWQMTARSRPWPGRGFPVGLCIGGMPVASGELGMTAWGGKLGSAGAPPVQ